MKKLESSDKFIVMDNFLLTKMNPGLYLTAPFQINACEIIQFNSVFIHKTTKSTKLQLKFTIHSKTYNSICIFYLVHKMFAKFKNSKEAPESEKG